MSPRAELPEAADPGGDVRFSKGQVVVTTSQIRCHNADRRHEDVAASMLSNIKFAHEVAPRLVVLFSRRRFRFKRPMISHLLKHSASLFRQF